MATGNMYRKFDEIWIVVFEMCKWTARQTYGYDDRNTMHPYWG